MTTRSCLVVNPQITDLIYQQTFDFAVDFSGFFEVKAGYVSDGNIPICYNGCNLLRIMNNLTSASVVCTLSDLSQDDDASVISWMNAGVAAAAAGIGLVLFSVTVDVDYIHLNFTSPVTALMSVSNSSVLFGRQNIVSDGGNVLSLPRFNIDARPKYLGFAISQASQTLLNNNLGGVSVLVATKDEPVRFQFIYFPESQSSLDITVYRLNAPFIVCPLSLPYTLIFQKILPSNLLSRGL